MNIFIKIFIFISVSSPFILTTSHAGLTLTPDRAAVYDNASGLFWYSNLPHFAGLTYDEQLISISNLTGNWHMASLLEFNSLDLNPDTQIYKTFIPSTDVRLTNQFPNDTLINIYFGRINEPDGFSASKTHKFADMTYNVTENNVRSPLQISTTDWKDEWEGSYGAWVVSSTHATISGAVSEYIPFQTGVFTLSDKFNFDYFWVMGEEPTKFNFDVLFFNGDGWEVLGGIPNFDGSSDDWLTYSMMVPEWARGLQTQIKFVLADLGQNTDPTVYLRNISSSQAVPEPATMLLLGCGLIGLAGLRRKFKQ